MIPKHVGGKIEKDFFHLQVFILLPESLLLTLLNVFFVELYFNCLSSAASEKDGVVGLSSLQLKVAGRKLILRNLMYLAALAFLALNFWSHFPFHNLHKLNKHCFQLPALLISVWNAILRPYSPLKPTRAVLGLQWQPARSLRASPVPKWGKMNSTTKAALHRGIQQHIAGFHVSLDTSS